MKNKISYEEYIKNNAERIKKANERCELNNELLSLENWFTWYDTQVIQHDRDMRLFKKSSIDIKTLDNEAITKAKRIKEIRELLKRK